jgi:hypothetical protein
MSEHMDPEIDRWKNGLDATLVFVRPLLFTRLRSIKLVDSGRSVLSNRDRFPRRVAGEVAAG